MSNKVKINRTIMAAGLGLVAIVAMAFAINGWEVPAAEASKKNPVKADATSIEAGKAIYIKQCKMCHGATGEGGKMAGESNLKSNEFKAQTDGAIFYKINVGYGKMPAFSKKISADNDKWHLVNYIRTL